LIFSLDIKEDMAKMLPEVFMTHFLKVLIVDAATGFYRIQRYPLGAFFGPVDLGLHLAGKYNSLCIGAGIFAGSIFPGSNRLVFTGFSPCWGGFYISSMGGAGLVWDDLGINLLAIIGKAPSPRFWCSTVITVRRSTSAWKPLIPKQSGTAATGSLCHAPSQL
jgi:hypothetical protein